jgi:hypothetical protein
MEIIIILSHLVEIAAHAPIETGIVATNVWLARVTIKAIPRDERPHHRIARWAVRKCRHQYCLDLIPVELAVVNRHRAKFRQEV